MRVMKPEPSYTILAGRKPQTPTEPTIREFLESQSLHAEANQNITTQFDSAIQQVAYITENKPAEPVKPNVSTISLNSEMTRRLIEGSTGVSAPKEHNVYNPQ